MEYKMSGLPWRNAGLLKVSRAVASNPSCVTELTAGIVCAQCNRRWATFGPSGAALILCLKADQIRLPGLQPARVILNAPIQARYEIATSTPGVAGDSRAAEPIRKDSYKVLVAGEVRGIPVQRGSCAGVYVHRRTINSRIAVVVRAAPARANLPGALCHRPGITALGVVRIVPVVASNGNIISLDIPTHVTLGTLFTELK